MMSIFRENRTKKTLGLLIGIIFIISPALIAVAQGANDTVRLKKGEKQDRQEGKILKDNFRGITVQIGPATMDIPWTDIEENGIQYGGAPSNWYKADNALRQGDYKKALELYQQILSGKPEENINRWALLKQNVYYGIALSLHQTQEYDKAIAAYDTLLKEVSDTRYLKEVVFNKVACFVAKGNLNGAIASLEQSKNQASQSINNLKMNSDLLFQIDLRLGQMWEQLSPPDFQKAKSIYRKVRQDSASSFPIVAEIATVALGYISLRENQSEEAKRFFDDVASKSNNPIALAGAYSGLGDVYFQKAEKSNSQTDYKDALLNYLKTNVLFYSEDELVVPYYANATLQAGLCFKKMAGAGSVDAKKQSDYIEFARALFEDIKIKFPDSVWATKASEEAGNLGK